MFVLNVRSLWCSLQHRPAVTISVMSTYQSYDCPAKIYQNQWIITRPHVSTSQWQNCKKKNNHNNLWPDIFPRLPNIMNLIPFDPIPRQPFLLPWGCSLQNFLFLFFLTWISLILPHTQSLSSTSLFYLILSFLSPLKSPSPFSFPLLSLAIANFSTKP